MKTRILLAVPAVALAFAASPALARDGSTARMVEKMRDPHNQQAMAAAVAAASEAILDMPLEPLARAAEAMGDRRVAREMRGARLGDLVGPEGRDAPREMSRKLPQMMGAAAGMAGAVEEMTPALKAMAREMGARVSQAMREGGVAAGHDDERDYRDWRDDARAGHDPRAEAAPPSAEQEPDDGPYATPAPDQGD